MKALAKKELELTEDAYREAASAAFRAYRNSQPTPTDNHTTEQTHEKYPDRIRPLWNPPKTPNAPIQTTQPIRNTRPKLDHPKLTTNR